MAEPAPPPAAAVPAPALGWFVARAGITSGPFATCQVAAMFDRGDLSLTDHVCREGADEWREVRACLDWLAPGPAGQPPSDAYRAARGLTEPPRISHAAYAALALFFGGLGIHNFCAGQAGAGLLKLMFGFVAGVLWITSESPALLVALCVMPAWAVLEAIIGPTMYDEPPPP